MRDSGEHEALDGRRVAAVLSGLSAVIVAISSDDHVPYATRGWGLTPFEGTPARARLVLSSDDTRRLDERRENSAIAVTAADPVTVHAVQMKGRTCGPSTPATAEDRAEVARYCDAFFRAVEEADGTERRLLERLVPPDFVACTIEIDELYDQSPGPQAGVALRGTVA